MYEQMKHEFKDPALKMIVYEREPWMMKGKSSLPRDEQLVHWERMEKGLLSQGFTAKRCNPGDFWGTDWVWTRGGPTIVVRIWCLAFWIACIVFATTCTDRVAYKFGLGCFSIPVWRVLVLKIWHYVFGLLKWLPINAQDPIAGLECSFCLNTDSCLHIFNLVYTWHICWAAASRLSNGSLQRTCLIFSCGTQGAILSAVLWRGMSTNGIEHFCGAWRLWKTMFVCTIIVALALAIMAEYQTRVMGKRIVYAVSPE